ncbi:MAG: putative transport system ATP-binding protein [Candidatus Eremiobacteraeota bacterium]|nr:putative transport system ATP-binding protein [Candidatus Eremiobacteraeota bacterium]
MPSATSTQTPVSSRHAYPVSVRAAVKTYGAGEDEVHALAGVSLDVRRGEMVALVGPSGCGKSTLLNLVGCVDLPTKGVVCVDGQATGALSDDALTYLRRDRVGTVFQFFNLLPALRVADNVALPLVLQRAPRAAIDPRVREVLAGVGLAEKARAYPAQLSGGQMQRVAIARAIVHRPAILLADEPTGNLDSQTGATVLALLRGLADGGQAIMMATHSLEAAAICDRVVRMQDGRIVG